MQLDVLANFASMVNAQAESTMAVIVNVLDMNDNKPVFTQDPFVAEVAEASAKGNDTEEIKTISIECVDWQFEINPHADGRVNHPARQEQLGLSVLLRDTSRGGGDRTSNILVRRQLLYANPIFID